MLSHGIATTETFCPLSFSNGATSFSKLVPESPMIQTVRGPAASFVVVAGGAFPAQAARLRASPMTAIGATAILSILFIEIPFLDALRMERKRESFVRAKDFRIS